MSFIFQNPPFNFSFIDGLMNALARIGNNVTVTGPAAQTVMHSFTLPARSLLTAGQTLFVVARTARTNPTAAITLNFITNGIARGSYTLPISAIGVVQTLVAICQRLSSGNLNVTTILFRDIPGSTVGGNIVMQGADSTQASNLDTTNVLIEIAAIVGGAGDAITQTSTQAFIL